MFAVVYIPQFSLQAVLRHEPGLWSQPVGLVDPAERPPVICDLTEPARALGITPGFTPTQAMARCGTVLIRQRALPQENAAMRAILQCAYAFSPNLEATAPGVCTLDLHGLAALSPFLTPDCGSPDSLSPPARSALVAWAEKLQKAVAQSQLTALIGIGSTPGVARHAATWGGGIEIVEHPDAFIAALPVAALAPSSDTAQLLNRWGIRTVGELRALGADALSQRLGLEALALLAAASSTTGRPLHLVHPSETFEESFQFESEVETIEPLLFLLRRFVDQLTDRLRLRGWVAQSLVLQLALESGQKLVSRLRLPQPTARPDVLFRALHTHLETLRSETPIQSVTLKMLPRQSEQKQLGLFETVLADPHQFQETLARLVAVLGPDRVGTPALENSHRPDAFRIVAPDFENAPTLEFSSPAFPPVPLRRFRPPIQAEVECAGAAPGEGSPGAEQPELPLSRTGSPRPSWSRPISIRCAVSRGKLRLMLGPWRASGHWWEPTGWEREEWDAVTADGQLIRLVRQPNGWFVEGFID